LLSTDANFVSVRTARSRYRQLPYAIKQSTHVPSCLADADSTADWSIYAALHPVVVVVWWASWWAFRLPTE
jgi:hypothetical protein